MDGCHYYQFLGTHVYSGILVSRTRDWLKYCQGLIDIQAVPVAARRTEGNISILETGVYKKRMNILVLCRF
jgi:hypothetical protein